MFRMKFTGLLVLALLVAGMLPGDASRAADGDKRVFLPLISGPLPPVTVQIDPTVKPSQPTLPGLRGGPPRPVGAFVPEGGGQVEFVANEVRLKPKSAADLNAFLAKYGGTVIHNGVVPRIPGMNDHYRDMPPASRVLVRIDPARISTANLVTTMEQAGAYGRHRFSSNDAARLIALITGERGWQVGPNLLMHADASLEHPDGSGGNIDAAAWPWMTEDDDPGTAGDQGLSVGVTHAWEYLQYHNLPPSGSGTWSPAILAVIDGGFALDTTTGVPLDGNLDFFSFGPKPYQYDFVDDNGTAGGTNPMTCTGGSSCPWHGQGAFGVAAARARNAYGSAGTAGPVAIPVLLKVDSSFDTVEWAIKSAAASGADVISLSLGFACPVVTWICQIPWDDPWTDMRDAVSYARSHGAIVVAAAGNEGIGYYPDKYIPCGVSGVICVGAIGTDKRSKSYSNWGPMVNIWAPTDIRTTPNPTTAANTGLAALPSFNGTSASTPFVAGVVALMRTLDPNLTADQARDILIDTANPSPDPRVTPGYIDAYRAVLQAKANQPPAVSFNLPANGASVSWRAGAAYFSMTATDLETPGLFKGQVIVRSNRDGQLCVAATGASTSRGCSAGAMSVGIHTITARAIDPHGAEASASITLNVVNSAPIVDISYPANSAQFYTSQQINFRGSAIDFDESLSESQFVWTSSISGPIGTGSEINTTLVAGTHTIQLTVTDGRGASGSAAIQVQVQVGAGYPTAQITSPGNGTMVGPGTSITLAGQASDPEQGALGGASLRWYSDIDGFLGTGTTLDVVLSGPPQPCNPETVIHTITLEATDGDGHVGTHQRNVSVGFIC